MNNLYEVNLNGNVTLMNVEKIPKFLKDLKLQGSNELVKTLTFIDMVYMGINESKEINEGENLLTIKRIS